MVKKRLKTKTGTGWSATMEEALKVVELVMGSGHCLVPEKPNQAMVAAGMKAGAADAFTAKKIYRAMVQSALRDPTLLGQQVIKAALH